MRPRYRPSGATCAADRSADPDPEPCEECAPGPDDGCGAPGCEDGYTPNGTCERCGGLGGDYHGDAGGIPWPFAPAPLG